ncbi:DEAD/DEAH box helicase [Paenibacillus spiritus]|uniref:DEAD/DEAH box helicase n=2 Tax=Paenibacillus spiritus TaxID=2496557 RepID=A0A5J5G5G9_9BACL|nr:DEAD/DEAH box helicase [Paenibacillus spiritus]KAA9002417.1 DEAD/DEAH box helicase [Paenibacillus spiritus]
MNRTLHALTVQMALSEYGDALLYALNEEGGSLPGRMLKHRLFAWHEESLYGTELEVRRLGELELIVLPAEMVLPYFAEPGHFLRHIRWEWEGDGAPLTGLAGPLMACVRKRAYAPSLSAYRKGRLEWIWDRSELAAEVRRIGEAPIAAGGPDEEDGQGEESAATLEGAAAEGGTDGGLESAADRAAAARYALRRLEENAEFAEAVQAAFTAAVFRTWYGTESEAADLRREYPALFERGGALAAAGMSAESWLIAIGWKADTAPFRPLLRLLEPQPDEPGAAWQLQLALQDKADPSVLVPAALAADGTAAGKWPAAWAPHAAERSAGWLASLRAALPPERLAAGGDVLSRPLDNTAAWQFLTAHSRRLLEAGWQVLLPAWWEAARRRKPRVKAKLREEDGKKRGPSQLGLNALVDFDWRISIGEADLSEEEFAELVARGERLVRFRDQWVPLDPELLAQIRRVMDGIDKRRGLSFQDVLQLHLRRSGAFASPEPPEDNGDPAEDAGALRPELDVELNRRFAELLGQLAEGGWPQPAPSRDLQATLRPYQQEGFAWLAFLRSLGLGACLADDMGLGKTVQLISYLLHVREQSGGRDGFSGPPYSVSLIICPTSVLGNWQKELARFAPSLRVRLHYGPSRAAGEEEFAAFAAGADVVLTSYATASLDRELLAGQMWSAVCLDEAQNIKNAGTKQSAAVRSFPAVHRIALTGTPIENRLAELWSIYDFLLPGYLGSAKAFQDRFAAPIEKEGDPKRTAELQLLIRPFMLRRKKSDPSIQLALPEKNETKTYVALTGEQASLYEGTVSELMKEMEQLQGMRRKGAILAALSRLKQLCDHPLLLNKELLPEDGGEELEAPDLAVLVAGSAKLERLLAMVRELREEGERCLIFTQYLGMGRMLRRVLGEELGEPVLYLHGGTAKQARDRMIEAFQSGGAEPLPPGAKQPGVFILSLKAGGVGLNLTAANHVFHFDRWWNPAVENQATDRAYRLGQTRQVQVHKFISLGTLEERIDDMLESKQQLSDSIIAGSENWITELSTDALRELVTLRRQW